MAATNGRIDVAEYLVMECGAPVEPVAKVHTAYFEVNVTTLTELSLTCVLFFFRMEISPYT